MPRTPHQRSVLAAVLATALSPLLGSLAAAQTSGLADDKITIGGVFAVSGPVRFVTEPYEQGIRAYFNKVNEEGGVNGRKIEWLVEDDAYQPAKALAATKKLIERDDVMFLFGHMGTPTSLAIAPYLEQKKVPFFPVTTLPEDPSRSHTFGFQASYSDMMYHVTRYLGEKAGAKKIGYFYQNDDLGQLVRVGVEQALKDMNLPLAADVGYERGTTDFGTQVLKLRDAGVDAVISVGVAPSTATAVKQGLSADFKPIWATFGVGGSNAMSGLLGDAIEGMVFGSEVDNQFAGTDAAKEFNDVMKKYYPDVKADWGSLIGYAQARFIVDVLKNAGADPSREAVFDTVNKGTKFEVGLMAPVSFGPNKHTGTSGIKVFRWIKGVPTAQTDWLPVKGQ